MDLEVQLQTRTDKSNLERRRWSVDKTLNTNQTDLGQWGLAMEG